MRTRRMIVLIAAALAAAAVDGVNEIWPTVTTNPRGVGVGRAARGNWAREDAQSIVIHDPKDTSIRLSWVDLS